MGRLVVAARVMLPAFLMILDSGAMAAPTLAGSSLKGGWIKPDADLTLTFSSLGPADAARIHVFLGRTDLTSLFYQATDNTLKFKAPQVPLPQGQQELVVFYVQGGQWTELGRLAVKVLSRSGFEEAKVTPQLQVSMDSQNAAGRKGQAPEFPRETYYDFDMQGGLTTRHVRNGLALDTQWQVVGTSHRDKALRFGQLQNDAPLVDLASYLVSATKGGTTAQLGHVTFGTNPLLISSLANRGVLVSHKINSRVDVAVTTQSGQAIVGYDELFGPDWGSNHISGGTVGVELDKARPGGLRLEISYISAAIAPIGNFDQGQVVLAERSDGYGLRLAGSNKSGRLRGEFNFARSSYTNPTNKGLDFNGTPIVDVKETTNNARSLMLAYDVLQNYKLKPNKPLTLTLQFQHQRIDPEYKTLAAAAQADIQQEIYMVSLVFGQMSFQVTHLRQEDNLDNLANVLKTLTRSTQVTFNAPLKSLLGKDKSQSRWWPMLALEGSRVHQFAGNAPTAANSDFNSPSHFPDQLSWTGSVGVNWAIGKGTIGYAYRYSLQDNRQVGRANADFRNREHQINGSYQFGTKVNLGGSIGRVSAYDRAQDRTSTTFSWAANLNWIISKKLTFAGSYNDTQVDDSKDLTASNSNSANAQLTYVFHLPGPNGRKLPGQAFLRYTRNFNSNSDATFGLSTRATAWTVNSGISLTFF